MLADEVNTDLNITVTAWEVLKVRKIKLDKEEKDLEQLQTIAIEDGIPYQTLISSILHRFVNGRLIERPRSA